MSIDIDSSVDSSVESEVSPMDRLWEEIVYIAYYLHWSFDSILELDHHSRARIIEEIGKINAKVSGNESTYGWEG